MPAAYRQLFLPAFRFAGELRKEAILASRSAASGEHASALSSSPQDSPWLPIGPRQSQPFAFNSKLTYSKLTLLLAYYEEGKQAEQGPLCKASNQCDLLHRSTGQCYWDAPLKPQGTQLETASSLRLPTYMTDQLAPPENGEDDCLARYSGLREVCADSCTSSPTLGVKHKLRGRSKGSAGKRRRKKLSTIAFQHRAVPGS